MKGNRQWKLVNGLARSAKDDLCDLLHFVALKSMDNTLPARTTLETLRSKALMLIYVFKTWTTNKSLLRCVWKVSM